MRPSRSVRVLIALFNTIAAAGLALYGSSLPAHLRQGDLVTVGWGAAIAAAVALVAVVLDAPLPGWIAVGYLVWAGLLAGVAFAIVFLALAVSLFPLVPRPGGSTAKGVLVAAVAAGALALLRGS